MNDKQKEQKEAVEGLKKIFEGLKKATKENKTIKLHKNEDDLHRGFGADECPYGICEGNGYTTENRNGKLLSIRCQCYKDYQLTKRLQKSKIQPNFWDVTLEDLQTIEDKITITHLKPKAKQLPPPAPKAKKTTAKKAVVESNSIVSRHKSVVDEETPDGFVERTYDIKDIQKGLFYFADNYTKKILSMLNEKPRKKTLNLMLIGDPGKGKTYMACGIAKEFMKQGKSVYFTRMRTLLDEAFEKKTEIRSIVRNKELLIIDELGQEYHTDTKWALKQIQDLFKERQETGLPIIVTTNAYPNELADWYEESLLSTFHGRFLMMVMHGEFDLRTLEQLEAFNDLDFLD